MEYKVIYFHRKDQINMKLKKSKYMMEVTKFEQLREIKCREKELSFNPLQNSWIIGAIFNN